MILLERHISFKFFDSFSQSFIFFGKLPNQGGKVV